MLKKGGTVCQFLHSKAGIINLGKGQEINKINKKIFDAI